MRVNPDISQPNPFAEWDRSHGCHEGERPEPLSIFLRL